MASFSLWCSCKLQWGWKGKYPPWRSDLGEVYRAERDQRKSFMHKQSTADKIP